MGKNSSLQRLATQEDGQGLAEYSLMLEQIAHAFTKNWIPAFAGMTLLFIYWSVMPAQAGIQNLLSV